MAPERLSGRHYRCPYWRAVLPLWLSVAKRSYGSMLLYHFSQQHPDQGRSYLERIST